LKALDIHTRAACVFQGVAVLIALQRSNTKITFGGFARAIGLIRGDEGWRPWHRQQVSAILGAIAALEREDGGEPTLRYHRIVNAATGECLDPTRPGCAQLDGALQQYGRGLNWA
jgi:hypothetical protein